MIQLSFLLVLQVTYMKHDNAAAYITTKYFLAKSNLRLEAAR